MLNLLAMSISTSALAADLPFSPTSSTGCPSQWESDCISNNVWGPNDSLNMCDDWSGIRFDSPTSTYASIGFPTESLSGTKIKARVSGWAETTGTKVAVQLDYLNNSNQLLGSETLTLHTGAAGSFGATVSTTNIAVGTTKFRTQLKVNGGDAWVTSFVAEDDEGDCFSDSDAACTGVCPDGTEVEGYLCGGDCIFTCPTTDTAVSDSGEQFRPCPIW